MFTCSLLIAGCNQEYTPKPKGYFKIDLPEKRYQLYQPENCPYTFEYPAYGKVIADTLYFGENIEEECWVNIDLTGLGGTIYLSYKEVGRDKSLEKLIEDAHTLSFKHTIKADFIDESLLQPSETVSGMLYNIGGNAASPTQFFITDSARHFLRGSLYFETTPNYDSLLPVIKFVNEDIIHLVKTLEFKKE